MSHAEAVHTLHPAAGATEAIVTFRRRTALRRVARRGAALRQAAPARHRRRHDRGRRRRGRHARRGGAGGGAAGRPHTGARPRAARRSHRRGVPRRHRRARHRARRRLPAGLGASRLRGGAGGAARSATTAASTGKALIEAMVAGYETEIAIGRACHPDLRQRGFHPAAAVGVFGAAMAAGKLRGLAAGQLANALGIAASSAAGLFAFVNGGADIKRLHAGHASREGLQAALLAEQGVEGPPDVIEARDGFMQAFAFGRADRGARRRAAAGRAVWHHRLLHQALSVLPPHPAGGRGAHRPARRRGHRDRGGPAHRRRRPTASPPSTPRPDGTTSPAPSSASPT